MGDEPVQLTTEHGVATLALARPAARNALDVATKVALLTGLQSVAADTAVRCVVLTGTGPAFCAGQDLKEHLETLASGDLDALLATLEEHYHPIARTIAALDKPVIAAVNGIAAGAGASLALLADYRVFAASAGLNVAFARIGLSCDTGTSWTLPRLVGPTRAMELLLTGRTLSAEEALAAGIATEVVPDDEFRARVATLARGFAAGPTLAYAGIRRAMAFSAGHPLAESLDHEAGLMRRTGESADHRVAVDAFLTKTVPEFSGR